MSAEKYRMTMLTIGSLRDVWAPDSLPLWRQLSSEEQELLERRFPTHTHAFHSIVRATLEAEVAWQTANATEQLTLELGHPDTTSGGPERSSYPPLLLGREAPFREASLGGPVSEANERGPVRGRPNLPSDFAAGSWNMRAQRCELCTGDPKQEGCEGYCPVRDEASVGFSWDALERQVADVEAVVLYGSLFPPTEHAGDFTDEQSYTLAHLGADLATYVRRHLLDFRPPEPRSSDVGGKAAGA